MNPVDAPTTKTQNLVSAIYEIRQGSAKAGFQSKLDTNLTRGVGNTKNGENFLGQAVYFIAANRKNKRRTKTDRPRNNHWAFW